MGRLLEWVISGFGALFASLLAMFGRKATVAVASAAAVLGITTLFILSVNGLVVAVAGAAPPGWISNAIGMFIPADFGLCIGSIVSAYTCRAAYDLVMLKIKMVNEAN